MPPMSDNHQVQSSIVSNQSTDNIEDAFGRLKIQENGDGFPQSTPYPGRPGERDCLYYLRTGLCGYGSKCRFNHPNYVAQGVLYYKDELPERVGEPDCEYFLKTGTCKYGPTCKYHHPKDRNGARPISFNILGYPMRQGEKSCAYYMRTSTCKFGVACKFHHPQPVSGPSLAYGMSDFLSPGLPFVGGFTTVSLPTATYGTGPRLQGPQAYVPIMVSPSQGILPPQGWNTYLVNASVSSTYTVASNPMYDSKNQADSSSSAEAHLIGTSNQNLPDRPEQLQCRYFMNTGTCKYGADCKYHHPKERISQLSSTPVNPLVLPSRPGQPICSNFTRYGFCKFGPNCKFDHSFPGYPYNHAFSMPHLSTYTRMPPANHSSETSPLNKLSNGIQNSESNKPGDNYEQLDSELQISAEHSHDHGQEHSYDHDHDQSD